MSNKLIDLNALSSYKTQSDLKYQDKLTAGTGISIDANNVISATGGGGGVTLPPAFAFNIQEPDFTATFALDNAFSTAVANQQFSNYKLGASLSIGGTYPGKLYLAHADYLYGSSATSSHHIAAVFVGSTSKTVNIKDTTNTMPAVYTALKNQIGNSHFLGCTDMPGSPITNFYCARPIHFTDMYTFEQYNAQSVIVGSGKLALFSNYCRACNNLFESAGNYSTGISLRTNSSGTATFNYYYYSGKSGSVSFATSASTAVSIIGIVLLK
jgi:hypothetical protein